MNWQTDTAIHTAVAKNRNFFFKLRRHFCFFCWRTGRVKQDLNEPNPQLLAEPLKTMLSVMIGAREAVQTPPHRLTVDEQLLLLWQDAGQVGAVQPTLPLSGVPGPTVCEVLVAVRLKLLPTKSTNLSVCKDRENKVLKNCKPAQSLTYSPCFIVQFIVCTTM